VLSAFFEVCHFAHAQTVVNVPAGGDVQAAALQVLQAGGGTINLAAGNYYINSGIVMGANTTINGAGGPGSTTQSVIYAPQTPNGIAMVSQAYAGASNLTLSNLVLDGNIPQAAMLYGTGNGNYAYNDTGIYFYDQSATTVGVNLTNIEVRHTLRGILTGLVDNLTISGCYFHDNNPGGFSHNMYLVATSGVEIDHTRSDNALTGDGLHIDFGGYFYTIRKSEFSGNNGYGILSQQDNNVTIEDSKIDYNTDDGIQIDAGGLLLTRDQMNINSQYGFDIPDTADGNGLVNGVYTLGDGYTDYFYQASIVDFTIYGPSANTYPAIQATGVTGVVDTADWTLNYPGYTYMGAVDFNANHLSGGSITFPYVGATVESVPGSGVGTYPLVIRYSNGTSANQTLNLSVNGGAPVPITFPPTGSYSTWATVSTTQQLNLGNNTVTMSVPTGATSAPEVDTLTVTTSTPNAPNAPTNLTGTATGPYSIALNWTAPAAGNNNAAQTYTVYRNGANIASNITATSYTDTRIFYGESTYSYTVVAFNQAGGSGQSNTATVTSGIDAPPGLQVSVAPSTPANNLSWLGVSGAASYLVRRSTVSGGPYQTIATIAANGMNNSYSDTSLAPGQTYYYVVAAEDANGNISVNSYQVTALSESFTLSAASSAVDLSSAATVPNTIRVVGTNGFNDQVTFSVSTLPSGVTAAFSPTTATSGGSTTLTFTDSGSAALGSYPITVTGTDGGLTSSVPFTLNVGLSQTITFNAVPQQAVGNTLAPVASASSGLPITFTVVQNGNCNVSNNMVTFLNGGACGIIANQYGNATYGAASPVGQVVQVGAPVAQTITFNPIPTQAAGTTLALTATASSGLPVSYVSTTQSVCTVVGSVATLSAGGTCTIVASQSGANQYGPAANVSQSFTVTSQAQSQTITFAPASPVTYGITPITLTASASSGLAVTYSYVSGPGTLNGNVVSVTGVGTIVIAASQAGNSSYAAATQVSASIVVLPATLTVTANNLSRAYGAVNPALTYGATGFVNGDSSSILSGAPALSTTANNTSQPGTYPIAIAQGTLSAGNNYTFVFVNGTLQVTGTATTTTTLSPSPMSAVYGQSITLSAKVVDANSSPVTGGSVTFSLYNAANNTASTFSTANVNTTTGVASVSTTSLPAGTQTILAVYVPTANYSASGTSAVVTITPAPIAINVNSVSKVYGAALPTLTGTLGATQNGDVLSASYTTTATAVSAVGTYAINATLTGSAAANYSATVTPGVLSVTPATLTATATSLSRAYGAANPTLTYGVTGFVNNDTSAILSGAPVLTTTATATSSAGPYAITITQGTLTAGNNYSFVLVAGVLTVTAATTNSILFGPISNTVYGSAPFAVSASASSGLPVTISVVSGNVSLSGSTATLIGGTVTVTGAGMVTLQASQAGNGNYPAAQPVQQSFRVTAAPLTATANSINTTYGAAFTPTGTLGGVVVPDTFTESFTTSAGAVTLVPVGSYTITPAVTATGSTNAANYSVTAVNGTLVVAKAGTTTQLVSSSGSALPGATINFTATVASLTSGTPTQTVTLMDGANVLGTAGLNAGVAVFSISSLSSGPHSIVAMYGGDGNFLGSSSAGVSETVGTPTFSVSAAPSSLNVPQGQSGAVVITVSGMGGYAGTVRASCASSSLLPCSFTPGTLTFTGVNSSQTMTATIGTVVQARLMEPRGPSSTVFAAIFLWLPAMLAGMFVLRRKTARRVGVGLGVLFLVLGLGGLSGCGGSVGPNVAAKGNYTFPIVVTDGTNTVSSTVTVTVQ
jgi:hypothetical protein